MGKYCGQQVRVALGWLLCWKLLVAAQLGTFTPPLPPAGLLLAEHPDTVPRWYILAGAALQNDLHPLIYAYTDGRREPVIYNRARLELQTRVGLGSGFDVAFGLPLIYQCGKQDPYLGNLQGFSFGDLRLQGRFALLPPPLTPLSLTLGLEVTVPTGSQQLRTGGGTPQFYPHLLAAYPLGSLLAIAKLGWLWRPTTTLFQAAIGPTMPLHLGLQWPMLLGRTPVHALIESANQWVINWPAQATDFSTEVLLGIRWPAFTEWESSVGLGYSVGQALGNPLLRLLASIVWTPPRTDLDHDGIEDRDDACPTEPEDYNHFQDRDGCPDQHLPEQPIADQDGDGIVDRLDQCPKQPESWNGRADLDGCPEMPDQDLDGIQDDLDQCPLSPETINGQQDEDGCPDQGPSNTRIVPGSRIDLTGSISFEVGQSTIKSESFGLLNEIAAQLLAHLEISRVRIEGHTDNAGRAHANLVLSQARADAVRRYLIERGIAATRLIAQGFGEEQPIADNSQEEGRKANRRVAFVLLAESEPSVPPAKRPKP